MSLSTKFATWLISSAGHEHVCLLHHFRRTSVLECNREEIQHRAPEH